MKDRWLTSLAIGGVAVLIAGSALAQTTGSGTGTPPSPGSGTGTSATQPAPPQPSGSQPSTSTAPGKAQPGTDQAGSTTGKAGPGPTASGTGSKKMGGTNGQADPEQVKSIQKALQEKGMDPGPIDGIMGPKTQTALRTFQKDQKLPETGRMDPQTLEKLGVSR